ncbi:FAD-dependent monooxygenase [Metalysinibacillus jejuensis]|uniref:FAD-dependent monooxygenase n=1 Tax=Metalysinibacillus jejuensis TaxID=914327 RepID=UPI000D3B651F|nr:FAD-dependent monooxygenase [Metalysinibacillus jejuensis]
MRVIIIGGGIGGLTAAVALHKQHAEVLVYEAASEFKPLGAGIGLGANAMQDLKDIGIGDEIFKQGTPIHTQIFKDATGKILNTIDFAKFKAQYGHENITIHRADLHQTLFDALPRHTVRFTKRCVHVSEHHDGVVAVFNDGTSVKGDLVIAADGIHSNLRKQFYPNADPRYAGYTCWRGLTTNDGLVEAGVSCEVWSRKGRFGFAPMQDGQVYWFACVNTKPDNAFYAELTNEQLAYQFRNFPSEVSALINKTAQNQTLHHDIYDIKPLNRFVFGRTVLLGDAAHATTPNMGQGAGQAIEDAITLAKNIAQYNRKEALHRYEKERVAHTKKVVRLSRQIGWAAQWSSPFATTFRDKVFPHIPSGLLFKRLQFLFKNHNE